MSSIFASPHPEGFVLNPLVGALAFNSNFSQKATPIRGKNSAQDTTFEVCIDNVEFCEIEPILNRLVSAHAVLFEIIKGVANSRVSLSDSGEFVLNHYSSAEYKTLNPDLESLSEADLLSHYNNHGLKEGRSASYGAALFSKLIQGNIHRASSNDDILNVLDLGCDFLGRASDNKGTVSKVFLDHIPPKISLSENQPVGSIAPPRSILFHVFYPDEIVNYIPVIEAAKEAGFGLYVSTPLDARPSGTLQLSSYNPIITKVPNIGRDILGFKASFDTARYMTSDECSSYLLIHTKKSPHVHPSFRKAWVNSMTEWMHDKKFLDKFSKFVEEGVLSMVASSECTCTGYGDVPSDYFLNYPGSETLPYASGTMFLASNSVLSKIFDQISYDAFAENPTITYEQHLCGGIPHAAERLFSYEAQSQSGIAWV